MSDIVAPSAAYIAGFNAGIDRARKVLESRCAYVFDAALKAERLPVPKPSAIDPAHEAERQRDAAFCCDPQWPS
jgi:hypothetical protein